MPSEPVISVFEFIVTSVPVSVIFELPICSPKSLAIAFVNLFVVSKDSPPILLNDGGPCINTELVVAAPKADW